MSERRVERRFTFSSFFCLPCPTLHFTCSRALGPKCTLALPTFASFTVTPAVDTVTTTFCFATFPPVNVYEQQAVHMLQQSGKLEISVKCLRLHSDVETGTRELTVNFTRFFGNCLLSTNSSTSQTSIVPSENLTRISPLLQELEDPSTVTARSQPSSVSTAEQNKFVTSSMGTSKMTSGGGDRSSNRPKPR